MLWFFLSILYTYYIFRVKSKECFISIRIFFDKKILTKTEYGIRVSIWLNIYVFYLAKQQMSFSIPCYKTVFHGSFCHPNHPFCSNKHFITLSGIHSYETCRRSLVQKIPKWGSYRLILRSKQQSFSIFLS